MKPDYSVIIPAYNEERFLPGALRSVAAAMARVPALAGEVIVVDNCSTDRTAEQARAAGARVVREPHRQIARARNAGGRAAHGRYLIFVDADTVVPARLLRHTLRLLESGAFCGGGTSVRFDRKVPVGARAFLCLWTFLARVCRWAAGSYVFCRRDAFRDIGGFDERFYASEEIHFSRALSRWGWRRGLDVIILSEPVITSARKVEWFTRRHLLGAAFGLLIDPSRLYSREGCELWYARPQKPTD
ncbi:MAG: glycosyltransferase [Planctomycetota bacterium]